MRIHLLLSVCVLMGASGGVRAAAASDRAVVSQRASEAGAWWMVVQASCDSTTTRKLFDAMNAALVAMSNSELQPVVVERIEEPHLDAKSRAQMEGVMRQATAARQQATEMAESKVALAAGKQPAGGLQRKEWQVARPIRSAADLDLALKDTERALVRMCDQGVDNVRAVLLDSDKGLIKVLR